MKILLPTLVAVCGLLLIIDPAFAQTWTQTIALSNAWISIASSADGVRLAAVSQGYHGQISISTNSGATWAQTSAPTNYGWNSVASSADGSKLTAVSYNGPICVSTNLGTNWTLANAPNEYWGSVASSADGTKLAAVAPVGVNGNDPAVIYTSTDSGTTWIQQTNADVHPSWVSVASSADGTKLVVVGIRIYYSTNSGTTWTQTRTSLGPFGLISPSQIVASSADGNKWVVGFTGGVGSPCPIYTSTNSGDSWTLTSAPSNEWVYVAMSADGNKIVAVAIGGSLYDSGPVYTSTDFGATWTSNNLPAQVYRCVASSADGGKLAVGSFGDAGIINGGGIYTSQTTSPPQLNLTPSGGNLTVSWLVPSTNFVLQQSPDLSSWSNVTNPPALNLTNLQNEVALSPTNGSGFYRLKTP